MQELIIEDKHPPLINIKYAKKDNVVIIPSL